MLFIMSYWTERNERYQTQLMRGLTDEQFRSHEDIEKWLDSWIVSKDEHFYRNGIWALPERWAKVVANDGQYFE